MYISSIFLFTILFYLLPFVPETSASIGDRSVVFLRCVSTCYKKLCITQEKLEKFTSNQSLIWRLTGWSCHDECNYNCMWHTVVEFSKFDQPVPQFQGKWPFVRWLGMQEPASAIFSVLNFATYLYAFRKMIQLQTIQQLYWLKYLWMTYFGVGITAWFFSTIFHSRDIPLTEKLDYFCAFALVLSGFYASLIRIFGPDKKYLYPIIGIAIFAYYVGHIDYLTRGKFDYGHHVYTSAVIGAINSASWLFWCAITWYRFRVDHVKTCASVIIVACGFLLLELFDFPPLFWTFDAHALWHLGTVLLPIPWTRFILDDFEFLEKTRFKQD